jgi:hypothetical protein
MVDNAGLEFAMKKDPDQHSLDHGVTSRSSNTNLNSSVFLGPVNGPTQKVIVKN